MGVRERREEDINTVRADGVDFHSRLVAGCLSPTSVPFLACGGSGWPRCHLAAQCHVWAGAGRGPRLPGCCTGLAPVGPGCGPGWGGR